MTMTSEEREQALRDIVQSARLNGDVLAVTVAFDDEEPQTYEIPEGRLITPQEYEAFSTRIKQRQSLAKYFRGG